MTRERRDKLPDDQLEVEVEVIEGSNGGSD